MTAAGRAESGRRLSGQFPFGYLPPAGVTTSVSALLDLLQRRLYLSCQMPKGSHVPLMSKSLRFLNLRLALLRTLERLIEQ